MPPPEKSRRHKSTLQGALMRYGLKKAFLSRWTGISLIAALVLPPLVPWGLHDMLTPLLSAHVTLLGFGLTVFGLVVIGGRDDFFLPIIKSKKFEGAAILERMALYLIWPLVLHGMCAVAILARLTLFRAFQDNTLLIAGSAWRVAYVFLATWALVQTYLSSHYLFRIALIRIRLQNNVNK